ncbi:unnamed protein product [Paramecium sonneborni]|uniref:Protein kinase domain-containing protein n=1 Tax=Paramecium sonneborni TaxID=65129 RepID=A0A8S1QSP9_9CILI|nr:unnamed protein product [Paramecium sonneborni]
MFKFKLIDYGSRLHFDDLPQFSLVNYIQYEKKMEKTTTLNYTKSYQNIEPWVIDIWTLGCVIVEILYGIPLWLSNKIIIQHHDKDLIQFAVINRAFDQIIEKNKGDLEIRLLLKEMLTIDPDQRIAPCTIIEFLQTTKERLTTE